MLNIGINHILISQMSQVLLFILVILVVIIVFRILSNKVKASRSILSKKESQPKLLNEAIFVDLSPKSADLVQLAIEIWRIENRISKIGSKLEDTQKRGLESSVQKLVKYLDKFHIKIIDHTDQKYNEGLSVEVLSFENEDSVKVPTIKETIEPTIICENMVVKKGRVVVVKNS